MKKGGKRQLDTGADNGLPRKRHCLPNDNSSSTGMPLREMLSLMICPEYEEAFHRTLEGWNDFVKSTSTTLEKIDARGVPLRAELKRTLVCRGKWEGFHLQHYFEFNKRLAQYEELRKGNGETQEHFVYATFAYCCAKLEWAAEQGVDVLVPVGKALMTALANGVLMEHNKGEATDGNPEEAAKAAFRRSRSLVGFVDISRRRYKIPLEGITESMLDIVMQLDGGWEQSWAKSQVVPLEIMLTLNKRNLGYLLLRYKKSPSSGGALCFRGLRVNSKWRKLNIGKLLIRVWLRLCRRYNFTAETELMNKPVICLLLRHHFGFAPDRLHSPVEVACSGPGETNDKVRIWANDYSRLKGLYSNSFLKSQNIEIMKDKPGTSRTIYVKTRYRRAYLI